jgi:threonylcarbamoyladenosine tRNA methylthiotransferase MtaB
MKFQVHTFGCKVNTYDSGLIQKNLQSAGYEFVGEEPQVHVLNTCAVTAEATKEAVKAIRRIKAKSPFSTIVVTGCAAQVDTDAFSNLPGADLVVANSHKGMLPLIMDQYFKKTLSERVFKSNIFKKEDLELGGGEESSHTRSFLKIQDGCNAFCSFCIIPYARGKSRSLPVQDLVEKISSLHQGGIQEVVLTGVHIGDYLDESLTPPQELKGLLQQVLLKTKIPRIRLTSLEPIELTDEILALYHNPRMVPHFHMSIQSANSEVLKEMKRKYTQDQVIESLHRIQKIVPGAFVGMDVIAGFPSETEDQFLDTYQALASAPWTRLHVFPYSERSGTRAAALDFKVPQAVRSQRAQKLRELSLHRYQSESLKQVGLRKQVLIQKKPSKGGHGLSRDYWNIQIEHTENVCEQLANQEVWVEVTGVASGAELGSQWMEAPLKARMLADLV